MEPTASKTKSIVAGVTVIVAVVCATTFLGRKPSTSGFSAAASAGQANASQSQNTAPAAQDVPATVPPADVPAAKPTHVAASSGYADGTYSATGSYMSPGGEDQIGVTLTLANGIVTDASVTPGANDGTSARYQNIFAANYKPYVIGKSIATLRLGKVSRSSLTPIGFNDALSQIRTEAKA